MAITQLTLLQATNLCLGSIGQSPITSGPPSSNPTEDEDAAVEFINEAIRFPSDQREFEYTSQGITDVEKTLTLSGGKIDLPANTARVALHAEDPDYGTKNVSEKLDGAILRLYNDTDATFTWGSDKKVKITYFLDFVNLPEAARYWVAMKAKLDMVTRKLGSSGGLAKVAVQQERFAWDALIRDSLFRVPANVFDNFAAARVIAREYPTQLHPLP